MRYCPDCGKNVEDNAKFCTYCGKRLNNDSEGTTYIYKNNNTRPIENHTYTENFTTTTSSSQNNKKKQAIIFAIIVGFILVVVLFSIFALRPILNYFYNSSDPNNYPNAYYVDEYVVIEDTPVMNYNQITGYCKNINNKNISYIMIKFSLCNNQGNIVDSAYAFSSYIGKNQTWEFSASLLTTLYFGHDITSFKISDVTVILDY
ncbi:MAG: zinc ribbon domain-containing protein [Christensenellaceae bacterium]|nr:zinc ribbon domain-containing protein [Christensenellaceae bacterium]